MASDLDLAKKGFEKQMQQTPIVREIVRGTPVQSSSGYTSGNPYDPVSNPEGYEYYRQTGQLLPSDKPKETVIEFRSPTQSSEVTYENIETGKTITVTNKAENLEKNIKEMESKGYYVKDIIKNNETVYQAPPKKYEMTIPREHGGSPIYPIPEVKETPIEWQKKMDVKYGGNIGYETGKFLSNVFAPERYNIATEQLFGKERTPEEYLSYKKDYVKYYQEEEKKYLAQSQYEYAKLYENKDYLGIAGRVIQSPIVSTLATEYALRGVSLGITYAKPALQKGIQTIPKTYGKLSNYIPTTKTIQTPISQSYKIFGKNIYLKVTI